MTETTRRRLAWELIKRELERALDGSPDDAEALVIALPRPLDQVPVAFLCSGCNVRLQIAVHPAIKDRLLRAWDQIHGQHQAAS